MGKSAKPATPKPKPVLQQPASLELVLGDQRVSLGVDYVGAYMRKDGVTKFSVTATCVNRDDARILAQALGELGIREPENPKSEA
ncbi:MAG: hypothetical protein LBJ41_07210 [Treponema sp.]|jgi:hypothetical protein|nr:hypothetical protein [Treponema sp.]